MARKQERFPQRKNTRSRSQLARTHFGAHDNDLPGGKPHARRGEMSHDLAIKFLETFPVGTTMSEDRFDTWAEEFADAQRPNPEDKVAQRGHVKRRHEVITRIKAASTHPRMWESGYDTYEIICVRPGLYEVCKLAIHQTAERQSKGLLSLLDTYVSQMKHTMQGIKWHELPPAAVGTAQHLLYSLAWFAESIDGQMNIQRNLARDLAVYQQPMLEISPPLRLPEGESHEEPLTDGAQG